MTDDEEDQGPKWMKRLRWAHSGLPGLDERINAIASLWAEGSLSATEFDPELRDAIRLSSARPDPSPGSGPLEDYTRNIRTAAQWMAFLETIHFCDKHNLRTPDERVGAFRLFQRELDQTGPSVGAPGRSWIADVCEFRSQTEAVDDPMHQLVRRWVAGEGMTDHVDLIEQSLAAQIPIRFQCRANPDHPEAAVSLWVRSLQARVQGIVLRETDAYCRAAGLDSPDERAQAWRDMLEDIQKPPPGRSL